jgi:hypothetical protein
VYNCYNSRAHDQEQSGILPRLVGIGSGIGWYGFGYGLSLWSDFVVLWQGCKAIFWVEQFTRSIPPVNELIFGVCRINSYSN